jgi:hypothetical protein
MATWEDVRRLALAMPGATEATSYDGCPAWKVGGKLFVWERPLRGRDRQDLGDATPEGDLLGVRTADLDAKDAVLAEVPAALTIPHLDGYPAVLVQLDRIDGADLADLVEQAWLARAPERAARAYLDGDRTGPATGGG